MNTVYQTDVASQSAVQEAILAAQSGNQPLARFRLEQAITTEHDNADYWIWVAWTSESPTAAVSALEQAVKIAPDHRIAQQGLTWARAMQAFSANIYQSSAAARAAEQMSIDDGFESPQSVLSATPVPIEGNEPSHTPTPAPATSPFGAANGVVDEFEPGYEFERVPGDSTGPATIPEPTPSDTWSPDETPDQHTAPRVEEDDFPTHEEPENLHGSPLPPRESAPNTPPSDGEPEVDVPSEDQFTDPVCEGTTVLAVDDSPTIRKIVAMGLEAAGYRVVTAPDGMEAVKRINEFRPSLILTDINMPTIDGYQLCKLVKSHDQTRQIPVIMLSGKDGMFDKMKGKFVGCDDYITKPFQSSELLEKVSSYLPLPVSEK